MELKQLYREIVNEHNMHPVHKGKMEAADLVLRGVNPSCGDDITLQLKIDGDVITDDLLDTICGFPWMVFLRLHKICTMIFVYFRDWHK